MNIYLDTNILVAYFNADDPEHKSCQMLCNLDSVILYTGILTLIEFESVIGRLWTASQIHLRPDIVKRVQTLPLSKQILVLTRICFAQIPVHIYPVSAIEKFQFNHSTYDIENSYSISYKLLPHIRLRTLDILQLTSALKIQMYEHVELQYFLTNDATILNQSDTIYPLTNIIPISSRDLGNILKIKI